MKDRSLRVLLALVVLNILDGDFASPSPLDWIKLLLLALCLLLTFRGRRQNKKQKSTPLAGNRRHPIKGVPYYAVLLAVHYARCFS